MNCKIHRLFILGFILSSLVSYSQNVSVDYFEVYTKLAHKHNSGGFSIHPDSISARIHSIPDTALAYATFALSISNSAEIDSMYLTLKNSNNELIYSVATKYEDIAAGPGYRVSGKTTYLTVGPFGYLKRFVATVKCRSNAGILSDIKEFQKY